MWPHINVPFAPVVSTQVNGSFHSCGSISSYHWLLWLLYRPVQVIMGSFSSFGFNLNYQWFTLRFWLQPKLPFVFWFQLKSLWLVPLALFAPISTYHWFLHVAPVAHTQVIIGSSKCTTSTFSPFDKYIILQFYRDSHVTFPLDNPSSLFCSLITCF